MMKVLAIAAALAALPIGVSARAGEAFAADSYVVTVAPWSGATLRRIDANSLVGQPTTPWRRIDDHLWEISSAPELAAIWRRVDAHRWTAICAPHCMEPTSQG
jgi:hypothetical protein